MQTEIGHVKLLLNKRTTKQYTYSSVLRFPLYINLLGNSAISGCIRYCVSNSNTGLHSLKRKWL